MEEETQKIKIEEIIIVGNIREQVLALIASGFFDMASGRAIVDKTDNVIRDIRLELHPYSRSKNKAKLDTTL